MGNSIQVIRIISSRLFLRVGGAMKGRTLLPLIVLTGSFALAQSTAASNNVTVAAPDSQAESKFIDYPKSMSGPASAEPEPYIESRITTIPNRSAGEHVRFFDKQNLKLFGMNAVAQTGALFAIQSHGNWMQSRGRTLDPFEKHFESYGYGWGSVYRYGGGVGLNTLVAYMFHEGGHHKLEHIVPYIAIAHAEASSGYALAGSKQGKNGW
jgi:hypothetical protein